MKTVIYNYYSKLTSVIRKKIFLSDVVQVSGKSPVFKDKI